MPGGPPRTCPLPARYGTHQIPPYDRAKLALCLSSQRAHALGFTGADADLLTTGWRHLIASMRASYHRETTWATPTGWAVVRDVLLVGPWRGDSPRVGRHRRAPADHSAARVLLRTVRCLSGAVDLVLECEPAFDYGRQRGTWRHVGDGYGEAGVRSGPATRRRSG